MSKNHHSDRSANQETVSNGYEDVDLVISPFEKMQRYARQSELTTLVQLSKMDLTYFLACLTLEIDLLPARRAVRPSSGVIFSSLEMVNEPHIKRAVAFVDGQNLFHAAKECFGYSYPNYEPLTLAREICREQEWELQTVRFYTGVPDREDDAFWHYFWRAKLGAMGHRGIDVYSRSLRFHNQFVLLPNGSMKTVAIAEEKGIDVRIALDAIHQAYRDEYDVALIFSQDQDLSEVADRVRLISQEQGRWIKVASAFPVSPMSRNRRGINKTDWILINRALYDRCIDPRDYRQQGA